MWIMRGGGSSAMAILLVDVCGGNEVSKTIYKLSPHLFPFKLIIILFYFCFTEF